VHENFERPEDTKASSDRTFGLVFFVFFTLIGIAPLRHGAPLRVWALALAAAFLVSALCWTAPLKPLNRAWTKLGLLLHAVVNPLVMALLFYAVMTPFGIGMRVLGKRLLGVRRDPQAATYWIPHQPPGPPPETMKNQF